MNFNEAVEIALRTWYTKDHELHLNPHHPLGKLLGEWGELLDDYMKSIYKPGYEFNPQDELGDIWYYVRILCHQVNFVPSLRNYYFNSNTDYILVHVMHRVSKGWLSWDLQLGLRSIEFVIDYSYTALVEISKKHNLSLDDLTASNWEKLKPGSIRGEQWRKARVNTDYVGGKITHE